MTPTQVVAQRVKELRTRRGLTAEQLAARLVEQGVSWQRGTVAKLETGRRENITVAELLALAVVLDVAPVHLLVPPDSDTPYRVSDTQTATPQSARGWIRGFEPLTGADPRKFFSEVPLNEYGSDNGAERYVWVRQAIDYLARAAGRWYRREDGTGVFEIELPRAGEEELPPRRRGRKQGGDDAGR